MDCPPDFDILNEPPLFLAWHARDTALIELERIHLRRPSVGVKVRLRLRLRCEVFTIWLRRTATAHIESEDGRRRFRRWRRTVWSCFTSGPTFPPLSYADGA
jgi:hypothetical protein